MNKRVTVAKRATDTQESFGKAGQPKYEILGTFWMSETFNKGVKSLREGAMDAYDTVMFRCRFNKDIDFPLAHHTGNPEITSHRDRYGYMFTSQRILSLTLQDTATIDEAMLLLKKCEVFNESDSYKVIAKSCTLIDDEHILTLAQCNY